MPKEKKVENEKKWTRASTWNMMGRLDELQECDHIFLDALERRIQFMVLQETGCTEYREILGV